MEPLIATDGAAAVMFWLVFGVWGVVEWLPGIRETMRRSPSAASSVDKGTARRLLAFVFLGYLLAFVAAFDVTGAAIGTFRWPVFTIGLGVIAGGVVLRQWAVRTLGKYFTRWLNFQDGQTLVSGGPYRAVRHPSYLGGLISMVGLGLALGNWLSLLAATACTLLGYVRRIRVEEAMLRANLGPDYEDYALGRARLIPGIW